MAPTLRKRRASSNVSSSQPKKSKLTRKQTSQQAKRCMLLELPAELRTKIFDLVAKDDTAVLYPRGKLASRSPLVAVSQQIRSEYLGALHLTAPDIVAYVKDFNFAHVITFINKLSDLELKSLSATSGSTQRRLSIKLSIVQPPTAHPDGLERWLRRFQRPKVRGVSIDATYRLDTVNSAGVPEYLGSGERRRLYLGDLTAGLYNRLRDIELEYPCSRMGIEAGKINDLLYLHYTY